MLLDLSDNLNGIRPSFDFFQGLSFLIGESDIADSSVIARSHRQIGFLLQRRNQRAEHISPVADRDARMAGIGPDLTQKVTDL